VSSNISKKQPKENIEKLKKYIEKEQQRIDKIYQSIIKGKGLDDIDEESDFRELVMYPERYPMCTEQNIIKALQKSRNDDFESEIGEYLDLDDPKEKQVYEFFKNKKIFCIPDGGGNNIVFYKNNNLFYDHDHEDPGSTLDKKFTYKELIQWFKKYPYGEDDEQSYLACERSKLEKYTGIRESLEYDSLPEAIDNPYMLREAQEWEHLTHMWGNAIDDIIGNVTNSPFEVNKGSYIDHDPETGKEVCVMRTIRPKAELKNREYRDKLKRQMYKLQQKINKAYNVHPSVMFIQYPIDNTNLTEGLIIGITKTSR
jgi:hypothetical protein